MGMEPREKQLNPISTLGAFAENEGNFRRLAEDFDSGLGIIPFIGAGLSIPLGFPSWQQFLVKLGARAGIEEEVRSLIRVGSYEEVADRLLCELKEQAFNDAIEDAFGNHKLKGVKLRGPLTLVPQLSTGPVLTTNFDHAIEKTFEASGTPFERVVWGAKVDIVGRAFTQKKRLLLKLHGDVDDRTDRILTLREYNRHYGKNRPLRQLLREIFSTRPVLFVGCSLSADRIVKVLSEIASASTLASHYAVVEAPAQAEQLRDRARFLSEHRIRPIWYPNGRHELIETLLVALLQQCSSDSAAGSSAPVKRVPVAQPTAEQQSSREIFIPGQFHELPTECQAISHTFKIQGHTGKVVVSFYPDKRPAELLISMGKEGSTVSGLMDCFAFAVSLGLQYGVPIHRYINTYSHMRFEPSGWSENPEIGFAKSLYDYIFRWLGLRLSGQRDLRGNSKAKSEYESKLPDECISVSNSFNVGGHSGVLTVLMYPDGRPGAVQIQLENEGPTVSGLVTCWCSAISIALQHGVPLKVLSDSFSHTRFEPSGWTNNPDIGFAKSIADYIGRWLQLRFDPKKVAKATAQA